MTETTECQEKTTTLRTKRTGAMLLRHVRHTRLATVAERQQSINKAVFFTSSWQQEAFLPPYDGH